MKKLIGEDEMIVKNVKGFSAPGVIDKALYNIRKQCERNHDPDIPKLIDNSILKWQPDYEIKIKDKNHHYHILHMQLPVHIYHEYNRSLDGIRVRLLDELQRRLACDNETISNIIFNPLAHFEQGTSITKVEYSQCKLFICHTESYKHIALQIMKDFEVLGMNVFVATASIEPTKNWIFELRKSLDETDVMLALLTPDFKGSKWTDQEIGYVFGRNIPIICVKMGLEPYGFIQYSQPIYYDNIDLHDYKGHLKLIEIDIFKTLIRNQGLSPMIMFNMAKALIHSSSYGVSLILAKRFLDFDSIPSSIIESIHSAYRDNYQVNQAKDMKNIIRKLEVKVEYDEYVESI